MSQFIVGLTGGIGSGKTSVSNEFEKLGIEVIDADVISRELVEPGQSAYQQIVSRFGEGVLTSNKQLNRESLRQKVFDSIEDKEWLNALLHPMVREQMQLRCQSAESDYCILAIPLLVENKLQRLVNRVLVVDVDEATQLTRAAKRDNNSQAQIKKIMTAQVSRQTRLSAADDVINNNGDLAELKQQVENLHSDYLAMLKSHAKA